MPGGRKKRAAYIAMHLRRAFPDPVSIDALAVELGLGGYRSCRDAAERLVDLGFARRVRVPGPAADVTHAGYRALPPTPGQTRDEYEKCARAVTLALKADA